MESLGDFYARFRSQLRESGPILPVIALVGSVLLALLMTQRASTRVSEQSPLLHSPLSRSELKAVEVAFGVAGLDDYSVSGGNVLVPSGRRSEYLRVVQEHDCLESFHKQADRAVGSSSLLEPVSVRKDRLEQARRNDLRSAICQIDGIHDALVQFDYRTIPGLQEELQMAANVTVASDEPIDLREARLIGAMILGSKAGLKPDQITITDKHGGIFFGPALITDASQVHASLKHQDLMRRLNQVLSFVPGADLVVTRGSDVALNDGDAATMAEELQVSVNVPSIYLDQIRESTSALHVSHEQLAARATEKIRSAVLRQLPNGVSENAVSVVFWEQGASSHAATPSSDLIKLTAAAGLSILGGLGVILVHRRFQARPKLKIYRPQDTEQNATPPPPADDDGQLRSRLKTLVEQDPDATAKSLAEWIDQAS